MQQRFLYVAVLLSVLLATPLSSGYPTGPPSQVCTNGLRPESPHQNNQSGNGGYVIATDLQQDANSNFIYTANNTYRGTYTCAAMNKIFFEARLFITVILMGINSPFKGWLVQAKAPGSDELLGRFVPDSTFESLLDCGNGSEVIACIIQTESIKN